MAERRGARAAEPAGVTAQPDDRKHLARVGSLLIVVLGSLLLGAILRQGEPGLHANDLEEAAAVIQPEAVIDGSTGNEPPTLDPPAVETARPSAPAAQPEPTAVAPPSGLAALADRAAADVRRMPRDEAWMLQAAAICDAASVERLVAQVDDSGLHVLPVEIQDRACFRICWGPFDSRERALAATGRLPAPIRSLSDAPQPRTVASLIP